MGQYKIIHLQFQVVFRHNTLQNEQLYIVKIIFILKYSVVILTEITVAHQCLEC